MSRETERSISTKLVNHGGYKQENPNSRHASSHPGLAPAPQNGEELAEGNAVEQAGDEKLVLLKPNHIVGVAGKKHPKLQEDSRHEQESRIEVLLREGEVRGAGYDW